MQQSHLTSYECLISAGFEFIQAAPTDDGRFEIAFAKDGKAITILTDEPYRGEPGASKSSNTKKQSDDLKLAIAVAITQQYEITPSDIYKAFSLEELTEVAAIAQSLIDMDVQVEQVYKRAWNEVNNLQGEYHG